MKEKDARTEGGHRMVLYVERDDATYGPLQTGSWITEQHLDDFDQKRRNLTEELQSSLLSGRISPVAYYMTLIDIAEADLAVRVGISRRKVRKHLTPDGFAGIDLALARKYAEVFGIPAANLFQVVVPADEQTVIRQEKTANPLMTVTRVGTKQP